MSIHAQNPQITVAALPQVGDPVRNDVSCEKRDLMELDVNSLRFAGAAAMFDKPAEQRQSGGKVQAVCSNALYSHQNRATRARILGSHLEIMC